MKRYLIIGDIHGCYDELLELVSKAGITNNDRIISVGDFVDRGPNSLEVFEFLRDMNALSIIGNHESKHLKGMLSLSQTITKHQLGDKYNDFLNWTRNLPTKIVMDEFIVIHAALEPGVSINEQNYDVICGHSSGEKLLKSKYDTKNWFEMYDSDRKIFFGHEYISNEPFIYRDKFFGIDTGACHGGYLTGVLFPEMEFVSVKSKKNYWQQVSSEFHNTYRAEIEIDKASRNENKYISQIDRQHFTEIWKIIEVLSKNKEKNVDLLMKLFKWKEMIIDLSFELEEKVRNDATLALKESDDKDFKIRIKNYPFKALAYNARDGRLDILKIANKPILLREVADYFDLEFPEI